MSQNQQTRSKLVIDAVAQAAAFAPTSAVAAISKVKAIAGLAGCVLRLFRSKEPVSTKARKRPATVQPSSRKEGPGPAGQKGGYRHG